jgi:hypothetical protein
MNAKTLKEVPRLRLNEVTVTYPIKGLRMALHGFSWML